MNKLPQEWIDDLAAFAAGVRSWSDFFHWFITHARELSQFFDSKQKRAFKDFTREQLRDFLLQEGYAIILPKLEPLPNDPEMQISDTEYEVYSEVFRQYDLFQFGRPDTLVADWTGRNRLHELQLTLEFDSAAKTYYVREKIAPFYSCGKGEFWDRIQNIPGLLDDYGLKNQWSWKLEKRFTVENGFQFRSELEPSEAEQRQGTFCLSRVGFDSEKKSAFVFLGYPVCAYYLLFCLHSKRWRRVEFLMAWVV